MKPTIALFVVACLAVAWPASAEVIEIPIPEFAGITGGYHTASLVIPADVHAIHGAWLRLRGSATVGQLYCNFNGGFVQDWPMYGVSEMADDDGRWWVSESEMPTVEGPFEWTRPYVTSRTRPANWEFLLDGVGTINLSVAPGGYVLLCGPNSPPPTAVIEQAVFIIEGDFTVQAAESSWGRLKAIYR